MKRPFNVDDKEPEESNFKLPSEKEHLLQVADVNSLKNPDGTTDDNIQIVNLEVVGGDEAGRTLQSRVNLDQNWKGFHFTRLFLKAIGEEYKGTFEVETDRWCGRQFYATVKHSPSKDGKKTYANIDQYNFDKKIEQVYKPAVQKVSDPSQIAWEE
jgi:hypothetical protein